MKKLKAKTRRSLRRFKIKTHQKLTKQISTDATQCSANRYSALTTI